MCIPKFGIQRSSQHSSSFFPHMFVKPKQIWMRTDFIELKSNRHLVFQQRITNKLLSNLNHRHETTKISSRFQ